MSIGTPMKKVLTKAQVRSVFCKCYEQTLSKAAYKDQKTASAADCVHSHFETAMLQKMLQFPVENPVKCDVKQKSQR